MPSQDAPPPERPRVQVRRWLADTEAAADPDLTGRDAALQRVCRAVVSAFCVRGAAIHLVTAEGQWMLGAASTPESARIADLAFTTGEGPGLEAHLLGRPVLIGDLHRYTGRWPGFGQAALEVGVHAVYSFPLQVGGVRLGVLEAYSAEVRLLDDAEGALARAFCHETLRILLADGSPAPDGTWEPLPDGRAEIYQAQGMVMVDLGVDVQEALVRMRAHSFSEGVPLIELAQAIIAGFVLGPAGDPE